jgi:hypothetical protein
MHKAELAHMGSQNAWALALSEAMAMQVMFCEQGPVVVDVLPS